MMAASAAIAGNAGCEQNTTPTTGSSITIEQSDRAELKRRRTLDDKNTRIVAGLMAIAANSDGNLETFSPLDAHKLIRDIRRSDGNPKLSDTETEVLNACPNALEELRKQETITNDGATVFQRVQQDVEEFGLSPRLANYPEVYELPARKEEPLTNPLDLEPRVDYTKEAERGALGEKSNLKDTDEDLLLRAH